MVKTYPHVWKRKKYLHTGRNHRCYGYVINSAFHSKKILVWLFNVFFLKKNISLVLFVSARDHARSSTFEPLLTATSPLICYTAVFRVVTQRHVCGEERYVTTLKTAVYPDYLSATATFLADSVVSASLPKVAVVETFNCISLTGFGYNQPRRNFSTGVYKIITTDLLYLKCTENGK